MTGLNLSLSRNPRIYTESADLNLLHLWILLKTTLLSEPSTGKHHNERPLAQKGNPLHIFYVQAHRIIGLKDRLDIMNVELITNNPYLIFGKKYLGLSYHYIHGRLFEVIHSSESLSVTDKVFKSKVHKLICLFTWRT